MALSTVISVIIGWVIGLGVYYMTLPLDIIYRLILTVITGFCSTFMIYIILSFFID